MPFKPTKREPKVHLDRLLVIADSISDGENWLNANFTFERKQKRSVKQSTYIWGDSSEWITAFPIFDPTDPIEVKIFTSGSLYGENFYNYADIRSELFILQDEVKEKTLLQEVLRSLRIHPQGPCYQHPHPEPEKEQDRDRIDLRRRWCAPDPFDDPQVHDQHGLSNGPEWLASALRLRRRR